MKKLILFIVIIFISLLGYGQKLNQIKDVTATAAEVNFLHGRISENVFTFTNGFKVGNPVSGTNIFTVDSIGQYSTDQYRVYKGSSLMSPYLPLLFKVGGTATTTIGNNLMFLPNPGAISFLQLNANNTVSALSAGDFRTAIGAGDATQAQLALKRDTTQNIFRQGIKIGNIPSGTSVITIDSITQFSTGDFRLWKGALQLSPNLKSGFKIGSTPASTIGESIITSTNPSAITYLKGNANNSVTWRSAAEMRTDLNVPLASDTVTGTTLFYTKPETKTVAQTRVDSLGVLLPDRLPRLIDHLDSLVKVVPLGCSYVYSGSSLTSGYTYYTMYYVSKRTWTYGALWMNSTAGNYTPNNYNGIKIATVTGTTAHVIDSTATVDWTTAANTPTTSNWVSGGRWIDPGYYIVMAEYSSSAETTKPAPTSQFYGSLGFNVFTIGGVYVSARINAQKSGTFTLSSGWTAETKLIHIYLR